ncbi:MAG: hypothetical protein IJ111_02535 [Eggerthellaceae bacterium]|nr:hypothetical protein [Eggerthellaceae bacterium]
MNRFAKLAVAVLAAMCVALVGCSGAGGGQQDAEARVVGHWVALSLSVPDESGNLVEAPVPEGLYFDFASDGSIVVTMPSEFDDQGHVLNSASFKGSWTLTEELDPDTSGGFEYAFTGVFPVSDGGEDVTGVFLVGELSQGRVPDNDDAMAFLVHIGETTLEGLASIDGKI